MKNVKYEILKKFDDIEIYRNIDEFYKMQFNCAIDDNFPNVNDLYQLSCKMQFMYASYERFKKQIELNKIDNYIVICDFENELIYLCENAIVDVKMYCVNCDCIFNNEFVLKRIENQNEINYLIKLLFINFVYEIL